MKLTICMLLLPVLLAGCQSGNDPRLSGSFVSDKAATLAYLGSTGHYRPEQLEKLAHLFGKLNVTYDGNTYVSVLDGYCTTSKYNIIETGSDYVLIKEPFVPDWAIEGQVVGKQIVVTNRITFTKDGYWVTSPMLKPPFKEKFIKKDNPTR